MSINAETLFLSTADALGISRSVDEILNACQSQADSGCGSLQWTQYEFDKPTTSLTLKQRLIIQSLRQKGLKVSLEYERSARSGPLGSSPIVSRSLRISWVDNND